MNMLKDFNFMGEISEDFIKAQPTNYSTSEVRKSDVIVVLDLKKYEDLHLQIKEMEVSTKIGRYEETNQIKLNLISNRMGENKNVIVYLHGYTSYCQQSKFLIPFLGNQYSLCYYDSRGHGKNKAKIVTFGLLQALELRQVINKMLELGYENVILWGRSMGASVILQTLKSFQNTSIFKSVKYVVADSPFSNFHKLSLEFIQKIAGLPFFLGKIVSDTLVTKLEEKYGFNLNDLNFENLASQISIQFLTSQIDDVIKQCYVRDIFDSFSGKKQIFDTKVGHNDERPIQIIRNIFRNIKSIINVKKEVTFTQKFISYGINQKKSGISLSKCLSKQIALKSTKTIQLSQRNDQKVVLKVQNQIQIHKPNIPLPPNRKKLQIRKSSISFFKPENLLKNAKGKSQKQVQELKGLQRHSNSKKKMDITMKQRVKRQQEKRKITGIKTLR